MKSTARRLRAGDTVQVRTREEILRTLDSNGQLDGMPFMPEMFAFCGKSFPVYKRAHKTCDTVFPIRGRRVDRAVHLETRCDGHAHGGCQAGCLIFWKEAWLKPVDPESSTDALRCTKPSDGGPDRALTEADVYACAQVKPQSGDSPTYVCQATRLPYATSALSPWDIRQYLEDYWSGNVGLGRILDGLVYMSWHKIAQAGIGLGPVMRWLYDLFAPLWGGTRYPRSTGSIPEGQPTPTASLNLQPGELVRVRSHEQILQTLTTAGKNRGMYWDAELVPFCGGTYRVLKRVTTIINESTGKMQEMKNPCIILDSVVCQSRYSECRFFCPRAIYSFWREVWLERVSEATQSKDKTR
jgi:hypothetical protein